MAGGEGTKRIFILDDHPITRVGVRELIESQPDLTVCGESTGAEGVLAELRNSEPDLVVLDLGLPGSSGMALLKNILSARPKTTILIYSMQDPHLFAPRAVKAGAKGYVEKAAEPDEILTAIRSVLAGQTYLCRAATEAWVGHAGTGEEPVTTLTDRELEVLTFIGQGKSTREIADACNLSVKTVETHRDKLKRKLNIASTPELVRYAVQWALESER